MAPFPQGSMGRSTLTIWVLLLGWLWMQPVLAQHPLEAALPDHGHACTLCVLHLDGKVVADVQADAVYSRVAGQVFAVMTADCLPVLFCSLAGDEVAAAHAGWRGLCAGVLEQTLAQFNAAPASIIAWLGPAIGPQQFEVGEEVKQAFINIDPVSASAFVPSGTKYLADIYLLAHLRLQAAGIHAIYGGDRCTVSEKQQFFSYRRDGITGRMASLVWLI